jgi:hypothetical protein
LSGLLDALIESWLDGPSDYPSLLLHLAVQFNYLYGYAPALKERSFANQLNYEHRQFHYDVLAGMESSAFPFRKHQRRIRDALLQDQYELQECSAPRDNADLFDSWSKIRLPPHHPLRKVTLWSRCPIFIEKSMAQVCGEMEWISNGAIRKPP